MKITKISVKNFRSYGDYDSLIIFEDEMATLVYGENGKGKTSLFVTAPLFALFGETPSKVDKIVNRYTKKDCKVEIEFQVDKDMYSIIRYRKHSIYGNKVVVFKNGNNISPLRADETQALINDIIGVSYNAMKSSVVFSPAIYKPFLNETTGDRLKVFEGILSLKIINQWAETTKKLREPILKTIADLNLKLDKANSAMTAIKDSNDSYKERSKKELLDLKKRKETIHLEIANLKQKLVEYGSIDVAAEADKAKTYKEVTEANSKITESIVSLTSNLSNSPSLLGALAQKKEKFKELNLVDVKKELAIIESNQKIRENNGVIQNSISDFKLKLMKVESFKSLISNLDKKKKELTTKLEGMSGSVCYTCGHPLNDEEHTKIKSELVVQSNALDSELLDLQTKLAEAESGNAIIQEAIDKLKLGLRDEEVENYLKKDLDNMATLISTLGAEIPLLESSAMEAEKNDRTLTEEIAKLNAQLKKVQPSKYTMEFILSLTEELSTIDEGIKTLEKELGDIDTKAGSVYNKEFVEENDKKIVILAKGISKIEEDIAEKEGDDKYYDTLLKLFSNKDGGIKKILIERMINIFNEKISDFLPIFFNDKKVELFLDKNLNEVIMLNDEEIEFSEFSTGEQKRFEIAISFALFSVVKQFFSSSVSFMVFDEVLDNGLDKKGVEAVKAIIESFSKTNTVIVISHKEEYKESFENRIALMKDDKDYSRIVEA